MESKQFDNFQVLSPIKIFFCIFSYSVSSLEIRPFLPQFYFTKTQNTLYYKFLILGDIHIIIFIAQQI